ncbi:MAG: 5'-nucleotidase C-terminal domain-containing protein, partial [Pseudomonadota bacterium]
DLYVYPNTLYALRITGADLRAWLERSAGIYKRISPGGEDQALIDPAFPSYNFDMFDGVRYRIDLSQPSRYDPHGAEIDADARRIVDLTCDGAPVTDDMTFVVATNNYRASGAGDFPGVRDGEVVLATQDTNQDIIARYIREMGTIDAAKDQNWRFVPMPGTTVIFDTSPKAEAHLNEIGHNKVTHLGAGSGGFARFRIEL